MRGFWMVSAMAIPTGFHRADRSTSKTVRWSAMRTALAGTSARGSLTAIMARASQRSSMSRARSSRKLLLPETAAAATRRVMLPNTSATPMPSLQRRSASLRRRASLTIWA